MSNSTPISKSVGLLIAGLLLGGALAGGLAFAGVFDEKPGVQLEDGGIDINLPDDINIGKKK